MKQFLLWLGVVVTWLPTFWPILRRILRLSMDAIGLAGIPGDIETWREVMPDMGDPMTVLPLIVGLICLALATRDQWPRLSHFVRSVQVIRPSRQAQAPQLNPTAKTDQSIKAYIPNEQRALYPLQINVFGNRHADGVDVWAVLSIKNRSQSTIHVGHCEWDAEVEGIKPSNRGGVGYSSDMRKDSFQGIKLAGIRIFEPPPIMTGWASLSIRFGIDAKNMRQVLVFRYDFKLSPIPEQFGKFQFTGSDAELTLYKYELLPPQENS